MMGVETTHPEYDKMLDEWLLVKACSSGSREVKKLKTAILPAPGAQKGVYNEDRYSAYLTRAIYTNITGRTKSGLTGAAFRLPSTVDLPGELDYLNDDADGSGQSLEQLTKDVFSSLLDDGRQVLLTDYPPADADQTAEQQAQQDLKATINRYDATCLINWKVEIINGKCQLALAVLRESYNKSEDEFDHDNQVQYRVLRLVDGVYTQQVYKDNMPIEEVRTPTMANGSVFDFIPLFIIGAQNNDATVDDIPLADIAHVNVGHYRNSADLEENSFVHGQMTLGITSDMDSAQFKEMNPNGIVVGANAGHFLGETGGFHTAQASENQIADKLQERKEAQMLALGARLVEPNAEAQTATAAKIDATGENSVLSDLVTNVEEGVRKSIEWCGLFMGSDADFTYEMNRQFFDDSIDPQLLMAAIQGYQLSVIPKSSLQNSYRKSGIVDAEVTNDDINSELRKATPLE